MNLISEKVLKSQLQISRSTLFRYKRDLGLPYYKVRGKTYYSIDEIKAFIDAYSVKFKRQEK